MLFKYIFALLCGCFLFVATCFGQNGVVNLPATPANFPKGNNANIVFDRFGNRYTLDQLAVNSKTHLAAKRIQPGGSSVASATATTHLFTGCMPGYFRIYLEDSCGMDRYATDPVEAARLNVMCQVLTDIANLIPSYCTTTGQTVNIWVRGGLASGLGVATPFFNIPWSQSKTGIVDNVVWETVNSGVDAFKGVVPPLGTSGGGTTGTGGSSVYFHGSIAFNFISGFIWHTNLHTAPSAGEQDLYTVALHEMMHVLGFCTLINYNGLSLFDKNTLSTSPPCFEYFSRYDLRLTTNTGTHLLTNGAAACDMYQYHFNPAASVVPNTILSPGGTTSSGCGSGYYTGGETDTTVCTTALEYRGSFGTPIPVYTPKCYEPGGSLSHFEDQCYVPSGFCAACITTNNEYFVMSNSSPDPLLGGYSATTNPGAMNRYPKPEERQALCDIGYKVLTTYGNAVNLNNYTYTGTICPGAQVVGFNDGISSAGGFVFSTMSGLTIPINGSSIGSSLLDNDRAAGLSMSSITGCTFSNLEVVTGTGAVSVTSGGSTTDIFYTAGSTDFGIQLLRYIPVDASGVEGNITYVYVYVGDASCVPSACNMVTNPGFESLTMPGSYGMNLPGLSCWLPVEGAPILLSTDAYTGIGTTFLWQIPNYDWFVNGTIHPLSIDSNHRYVALCNQWHNSVTSLTAGMQEQLSVGLDSGQQYRVSFWGLLGGPTSAVLTDPIYASLLGAPGGAYAGIDSAVACCISNLPTHIQFAIGSTFPLLSSGLLYVPHGYLPPSCVDFADFNILPNNYLWKYYSQDITYNGPNGGIALYIQGAPWLDSFRINDSSLLVALDDISITPITGACPFSIPGPVGGAPFSLASVASVCVAGGTFSWPTLPVTAVGGLATPTTTTSGTFVPTDAYMASLATGGTGMIPVSYTYTTLTGCTNTVYTTVQIDSSTLGVATILNTPGQVWVYPNPATDILTIKTSKHAYKTFSITNMIGQVIIEQNIDSVETFIDLNQLSQGVYSIVFRGEGASTVRKFVKM